MNNIQKLFEYLKLKDYKIIDSNYLSSALEEFNELKEFIEKVADDDNWRYNEINDKYGDYIGSYYTWENDYYDPQDVAYDILNKIFGNLDDE